MLLSRRWSAFLVGVGLWNWTIWPRFATAIWADARSWDHDAPTAFFVVHAVLIVSALVIGTVVGWLGVRGWRAAPNPR